jgi:hypothetical protein
VSREKLRRLAFVALLFVGGEGRANQNPTAERCGVDQNQPAQHIFANPDGKRGWREYANGNDVPELELDAGGFARLWSNRTGNILVRMEEPGEDFAAYTDYCFDSAGQLIGLKFQLRTAWGWGYREEGVVLTGKLSPEISEFFDIKTESRIARPEQAAGIPDALKPHLFLRKSRLPFFKLLPDHSPKFR